MSAIEDRLAEAFTEAGVEGFLHAIDLESGREVRYRSEEPVVLASVVKLSMLVELFRRFDVGDPAADARVRVPAEGRCLGPTGLSVMRDEVELSWRDLAYLMIAVSDNTAADVVAERVGVEHVNATLRALGLERTTVRFTCAGLFEQLAEDLGTTLEALSGGTPVDLARVPSCRQLAPEHGNVSTAEETTRLLTLVWRDEAASPASCDAMRGILRTQVWPHRLSAGFPEDGVRIGAKTGTLFTVRNEAGVVELPDGGRCAVAVFTRAHDTRRRHPAADAVIGRAGRLAVDELRAVSDLRA